jgi:hypothetical protein
MIVTLCLQGYRSSTTASLPIPICLSCTSTRGRLTRWFKSLVISNSPRITSPGREAACLEATDLGARHWSVMIAFERNCRRYRGLYETRICKRLVAPFSSKSGSRKWSSFYVGEVFRWVARELFCCMLVQMNRVTVSRPQEDKLTPDRVGRVSPAGKSQ